MATALGIDIGGMSIKCALVDEEGKIGKKVSLPFIKNEPQDKTMDRLVALIEKELLDEMKATGCLGIGVGCPGAINGPAGVCDYANNLGWAHLPIKKILEERLGFTTSLDNDANAALLGEVYFGAAKQYKNAILLTLGTGVGSGIFLNGKIYSGLEGKGAELGHMVIKMGGRQCTCGRKGCFEAYASATALLNDTKEAIEEYPDSLLAKLAKEQGVNGIIPFEAEKQGDLAGKEVVDEYCACLGEGCANIANIFRPEAILLGGGVSGQKENLTSRVAKYMHEHLYGFSAPTCPEPKIVTATLGNNAGIYGAAALAFEAAK